MSNDCCCAAGHGDEIAPFRSSCEAE